jgi:uncharacterized RDD family membrane protein YckC
VRPDGVGGDDPNRAGSPGPRWGGDGRSLDPVGRRAAGEQEEPIHARLLPGEERGRRKRPAPPPGAEDYAPAWRRAAAWLIDELTKTGIWLAIMLVIYVLTGGLPAAATGSDLVALAPRAILSVGYDWLFWSQGWTPGTTVMGMRIVRGDGGPPGPRSALVRVGVSILSGGAFFIGYAWMFWHPRRQTWHDMAAGTFVVTLPQEEDQR